MHRPRHLPQSGKRWHLRDSGGVVLGQTRADRLVTELAQAGFRARTVEFNLGPPRGLVLQIRVDGYPSVQDAERDLTRIRELPGYGDAHLLAN